MTATKHSTVETNGIRMHVAEEGAGPLVLLCHGFPESWYSWRHQLRALARRRLSRRRARHARLRKDRSTRADRPVHAPASRRRHGRPARRPGRATGGDRRSRLGRAGGLAYSADAPRPLPRCWRPQRSVSATLASASNDGDAPRPTTNGSISSISSSRASPRRSSSAMCAIRCGASCTASRATGRKVGAISAWCPGGRIPQPHG